MNAALLLLFTINTQTFQLPPHLIESICYVESKYDVNAVHHDDGDSNSVGVCQIKLKTAQWLGFKGTEKDLMLPSNNVYYASKYLAKNLKRYKGVTIKAIISYNQGSARDLTTTIYSDKVLKQWRSVQHECKSNYCPADRH